MMEFADEAHIALLNLKVSPSAKALIKTTGFLSLRELLNVQPVRLSREIGMDPRKVLTLVNEIKACAASDADLAANEENNAFVSETGEKQDPNEQLAERRGVKRGRFSNNQSNTTALMLLAKERVPGRHIITYCRALDQLIGGGLSLGEVTEIVGVPGSGKTQLAMQLAVNVCIPGPFGGLGGECLYIDTEGSFAVERVRDMVSAMLAHLERVAGIKYKSGGSNNDNNVLWERQTATLANLNLESILSKIHYSRVHTHAELVAVVLSLGSILQAKPGIKLVVVDSVAFHFRQEFNNMAVRTRLLNTVSQTLNSLAATRNLAVVVTNQMTTKVLGGSSSIDIGVCTGISSNNNANTNTNTERAKESSYFAPALGESWSHAITSRLVITKTDILHHGKKNAKSKPPSFVRKVTLTKSPYLKPGECNFIVTKAGVRDYNNNKS